MATTSQRVSAGEAGRCAKFAHAPAPSTPIRSGGDEDMSAEYNQLSAVGCQLPLSASLSSNLPADLPVVTKRIKDSTESPTMFFTDWNDQLRASRQGLPADGIRIFSSFRISARPQFDATGTATCRRAWRTCVGTIR